MKHPPLTSPQIRLLLLIEQRCHVTGRMLLKEWQRAIAVPLWRRELIEIWWRQMAGAANRGPYFSLTAAGYQLACALLSARDDRRARRETCVQPQPRALAA